jgi:hypothetical protein
MNNQSNKYFNSNDGKSYKFTEEELIQYKEICFKIWGGVPLDVNWAMETPIYKQALNKKLNDDSKK